MGNTRSIQERIVIPLKKKKKKDCHVERWKVFFFLFLILIKSRGNQTKFSIMRWLKPQDSWQGLFFLICHIWNHIKFVYVSFSKKKKKKKLVYVSIKKSTTWLSYGLEKLHKNYNFKFALIMWLTFDKHPSTFYRNFIEAH